MKKFFIKNLLLLALFSASLSFAAGEEDEITTLLAMARYSGSLTTEQQDVYREQLEEWAHQRGGQSYINVSVARELQENLLQQADMPMQAGPAREFEEKEEQEVKEAKAEKKSSVSKVEEPGDNRPKKKSDSKALEYLFKHKGVPAAVVAEHMAGFVPFIPLEWNVRFPKGKKVLNCSETKGLFDYQDKLLVSPDGRYAVVVTHHMGPEGSKIYVWDMRRGQANTLEILPNIMEMGPRTALNDVSLGIKGQLACLCEVGRNRRIVRLINLASNKISWEKPVSEHTNRLSLSVDGRYLMLRETNVYNPAVVEGKVFTGLYTDSGNPVPANALPLGIDLISARMNEYDPDHYFVPNDERVDPYSYSWEAHSFDQTRMARRIFKHGAEVSGDRDTIVFYRFIPPVPYRFTTKQYGVTTKQYGVTINIFNPDQFTDLTMSPDKMSLSPDGLRVCIVRNLISRYEVQIYNALDGSKIILDEIGREHKDPREWVYDHFKIIGVSFSPGGNYLMLALYDMAKGAFVMKLYDLRQAEMVNDGGEPAAQHEFSGNVPAAVDDGGAGDCEGSTDDEMPPLEELPDDE